MTTAPDPTDDRPLVAVMHAATAWRSARGGDARGHRLVAQRPDWEP
jgi:hypothetical protein